MTNIDLVMNVLGCDVGAAIRWFSKNFKNLPTVEIRIKRSREIYVKRRHRAMTLQNLVTSEGWMSLRPAAKVVLTAIFARTPAAGTEQYCLHCTYSSLMRWTGIRSRATISAALQELRKSMAIQTSLVATNFRTRRGFWLKELLVRVSPRAMRPVKRLRASLPPIPRGAARSASATSPTSAVE